MIESRHHPNGEQPYCIRRLRLELRQATAKMEQRVADDGERRKAGRLKQTDGSGKPKSWGLPLFSLLFLALSHSTIP